MGDGSTYRGTGGYGYFIRIPCGYTLLSKGIICDVVYGCPLAGHAVSALAAVRLGVPRDAGM